MHERIIAPGHAQAADDVRAVFAERRCRGRDPRAFAAVALGSLVGYGIEETMFGAPPGGVSEDDFIEAWVDTCVTFVAAALPRTGKEK